MFHNFLPEAFGMWFASLEGKESEILATTSIENSTQAPILDSGAGSSDEGHVQWLDY